MISLRLVSLALLLAGSAEAAELSTLERAYLKELVFLKAEKAELQQEVARGEEETERLLAGAKGEIDLLTGRLVALRRQAARLEEQLRDAPAAKQGRIDAISETLARAKEIAGDAAIPLLPKDRVPAGQELASAVISTFDAVAEAIEVGGTIRRESGTFYSVDGRQIRGEIVRVGGVAAYGVAAEAAGALVPAGRGMLELHPFPADRAARELAAGRSPGLLPIFLVDSFFEQEEEVASVEPAARTKDEGGIVQALISLPIFEAAWVLYLLIIMSLVSVGVMVERSLFYRRHRVDTAQIRNKLEDLLHRGDYAGAAEYLKDYDSLETNVVLFGLREHEKGPDSVEDLIRGAEAHERLRYNRWLSFLATVGSNSPFIGLFGTVLGIIRAFGDLSADVGNASGSVMAGISEALIATAVGLLVAIPAVIAYNAFQGRVKTVLANAELLSKTLLSSLKAHDILPHADALRAPPSAG